MQDFIDDVFDAVDAPEGRQCAECAGVAEPDDTLCEACILEQCFIEFCDGDNDNPETDDAWSEDFA